MLCWSVLSHLLGWYQCHAHLSLPPWSPPNFISDSKSSLTSHNLLLSPSWDRYKVDSHIDPRLGADHVFWDLLKACIWNINIEKLRWNLMLQFQSFSKPTRRSRYSMYIYYYLLKKKRWLESSANLDKLGISVNFSLFIKNFQKGWRATNCRFLH